MKLLANLSLCLFFSFFFLNTSFAETLENKSSLEYRSMQRVRIDFESPNGYVRPLLLGFTTDNAATDGVDYGYDGSNFDQFPDDLFWMIEDDSYVIQGVGEFDETKQYPLGLFLENSGTIKISLNSLENFDNAINIFVYDSLLNTYTAINDSNFNIDMTSGEYTNRFYIAFLNPIESNEDSDVALSTDEFNIDKPSTIKYLSNSKELIVKSNSIVSQIDIYSMSGKRIKSLNNFNSKEVKIHLQTYQDNYAIVKVSNKNSQNSKVILLN